MKAKGVFVKQCAICGKDFTAHGVNALYCSYDCRQKQQLIYRLTLSTPKMKLRFMVLARDGFRCRYCGQGSDDGKKLEVDHIVPKLKGGTDDMANLVTACRECNQGKKALLLLKGKQIPSFLAI